MSWRHGLLLKGSGMCPQRIWDCFWRFRIHQVSTRAYHDCQGFIIADLNHAHLSALVTYSFHKRWVIRS
jgi:hypothetical protein